MLRQQLAEKQDAISKLQKEKDDLAASLESENQNNNHSEQASDVKSNEDDNLNPTQEVSMVILINAHMHASSKDDNHLLFLHYGGILLIVLSRWQFWTLLFFPRRV